MRQGQKHVKVLRIPFSALRYMSRQRLSRYPAALCSLINCAANSKQRIIRPARKPDENGINLNKLF